MACHSGNLGQLVRKGTVDSATIELVILKTKPQVIYQLGTEGVVPVDSQHRGPFEGCATITDRYRKRGERGSRQVLVVKHFRDVILGSNVFVNLLGNGIRIRT